MLFCYMDTLLLDARACEDNDLNILCCVGMSGVECGISTAVSPHDNASM